MRNLSRLGCLAFLIMGAVWQTVPCAAADVQGGHDHPLVGRYEGSQIVGYRTKDFDEVKVIAGPFDPSNADQTGTGFQMLEGREILIYYLLPQGRSALEAQRNYLSSLNAKGFTTLFTCNAGDGSCFVSKSPEAAYLIGNALGDPNGLPRLLDDYPHNWFDQKARYILARGDSPAGAVYASISLGESARGTVAVVRVIETKDMESGKIVFLNAGQMEKAIGATGRVSLDGLQFNPDQDTLRPESKPTLDEIAKLMTGKPALSLQIVGPADAQRAADQDVDLAQRRAGRVAEALQRDYGIEAARLSASAPSASDSGDAKARRVELVAR